MKQNQEINTEPKIIADLICGVSFLSLFFMMILLHLHSYKYKLTHIFHSMRIVSEIK